MDENELDETDATVDAERAAVIATLRAIAERLAELPQERAYEAPSSVRWSRSPPVRRTARKTTDSHAARPPPSGATSCRAGRR